MHKIYKESMEEFNDRFVQISQGGGYLILNTENPDRVKNFLTQHTIKMIEEEIERLEKSKIQIANAKSGNLKDQIEELNLLLKYQDGYNQAINEMKKYLLGELDLVFHSD